MSGAGNEDEVPTSVLGPELELESQARSAVVDSSLSSGIERSSDDGAPVDSSMVHINGEARPELVKSIKRKRRPKLLPADKAEALFPELVAERPGILTGYRVHFTPRQCVGSWTYLHNESGNIWTHLIASAVALAAVVWICANGVNKLQPALALTAADTVVVALYAVGAATCLSASVVYHTFLCCSRESFFCCKRLDHAGVLGLLAASDLPMVYFGFYGHPVLQTVYIALVMAAVAGVACFMLTKSRAALRYNSIRQVFFVALVAVGWTHMAHEVILKGGIATPDGRASLGCWIASFAFYAVGFVFFLTKFPERRWPGKFDTWGHSHQLWHVMIIAGAAVHFNSIIVYIKIAKGLS